MKKVLIIDGGGRAHILADKYSSSNMVNKILVAPGNDLILDQNPKVQIFKDIKTTDLKKILNLVQTQKPDLIDVAQDDAIAAGVTDLLRRNNSEVLGPSKKAGRLEWDKAWSRRFMKNNNLPIPKFKVCNSEKEGLSFINKQQNSQWYIKASGLAAGKGAIYAKNNSNAIRAIKQMKNFKKSGKTFLIEEYLEGEELSAFAIVSEKDYKILGYAQDHKKLFENDLGPNTGGMGCSAPPGIATSKVQKQVKEIFEKTIKGLAKLKIDYIGILYLGVIIDKSKNVKIIEFNARWGDPEAQVIIPSIKNDFYKLSHMACTKKLKRVKVTKDTNYRVVVTVASKGYPNNYKKIINKKIIGFENILNNKKINVYGASIKKVSNEYLVGGGRLFYVTAKGSNVNNAKKIAYNALSTISKKNKILHFRKDIGYRDANRIKNEKNFL